MRTKNQSCEVRFLRYRVRQNFLTFWTFLPFYPSSKDENQNFENMKKASGDAIILQMCTKNHNHMMYASPDMECDRHVTLF